ncbi:hypothetical protein B0H11DRAFT_1943542 [Mycena galericulata]|nr:hypothetical protein B0H11DRAFT_1943542 [Mycena galericulata]
MGSDLTANHVPASKNYIAKLPIELLSEIFTSIVPKPRDWRNFRHVRKILSSVDRHWRSVAHSTPGLWTLFPINPATLFAFVASSSLERTKSFPLSISLLLAHWNEGRQTAKDVLSDIFPFLIAHFVRIQRLAIDCQLSDWDSIAAQLQLETSNTEGLRGLSVSFNLRYGLLSDMVYNPIFPAPFYNSSRLLELNLEKAPTCWVDTRAFAFLVRLRLVDLGRYTQIFWSDFAKTLEATTCLEILELSNVECAHTDTSQRVILPFVKEFTPIPADTSANPKTIPIAKDVQPAAVGTIDTTAASWGSTPKNEVAVGAKGENDVMIPPVDPKRKAAEVDADGSRPDKRQCVLGGQQ